MHVNVVAYAALPVIWMTVDERFNQQTICEELCRSASSLDLTSEYAECEHLSLTYAESLDAFPEFKSIVEGSFPLPYSALRAEFSFKIHMCRVSVTSSDPANYPITDKILRSIVLYDIRDIALDFFRDITLAANIARPGALHIAQLAAFLDDIPPYSTKGSFHAFGEARKRAAELKWPVFQELAIVDVWVWLNKLKSSVNGGAKRVRLAIAALTHLFNEDASDENSLALVWALAGLESIYGEGNVGLKTQILKKSEALLGERKENKTKFSWMYDYRSRMLHGDIDLNPSYRSKWLETMDTFNEESSECQKLTTAMLLATVQNLCARNVFGIDFEYHTIFEGDI